MFSESATSNNNEIPGYEVGIVVLGVGHRCATDQFELESNMIGADSDKVMEERAVRVHFEQIIDSTSKSSVIVGYGPGDRSIFCSHENCSLLTCECRGMVEWFLRFKETQPTEEAIEAGEAVEVSCISQDPGGFRATQLLPGAYYYRDRTIISADNYCTEVPYASPVSGCLYIGNGSHPLSDSAATLITGVSPTLCDLLVKAVHNASTYQSDFKAQESTIKLVRTLGKSTHYAPCSEGDNFGTGVALYRHSYKASICSHNIRSCPISTALSYSPADRKRKVYVKHKISKSTFIPDGNSEGTFLTNINISATASVTAASRILNTAVDCHKFGSLGSDDSEVNGCRHSAVISESPVIHSSSPSKKRIIANQV